MKTTIEDKIKFMLGYSDMLARRHFETSSNIAKEIAEDLRLLDELTKGRGAKGELIAVDDQEGEANLKRGDRDGRRRRAPLHG